MIMNCDDFIYTNHSNGCVGYIHSDIQRFFLSSISKEEVTLRDWHTDIQVSPSNYEWIPDKSIIILDKCLNKTGYKFTIYYPLMNTVQYCLITGPWGDIVQKTSLYPPNIFFYCLGVIILSIFILIFSLFVIFICSICFMCCFITYD